MVSDLVKSVLQMKQWFDKNVEIKTTEWDKPQCSRCGKEAPIVRRVFAYGEVIQICKSCKKELKVK